MRKTLMVSALALTLAALAAAPVLAQEVPAALDGPVQKVDWRGHGDGWGREGRHHRRDGERFGHHGRGHGGRIMERIEIFDLNKDGAVTQDEVDQFRKDQVTKFDADKNGTLSLEEYQALWLDQMRERMVDAFQRHDDDGDGRVTADEFNERFANMVKRFDRNDDGKLSPDDRRGDR
jgi:Ca2+-binding EF-hand superfamily protein